MLSPFRILQKKRYNTFDSKLIRIKTHLSNTEYTFSSNKNKNKIGHLHDAVISLLPESLSFFPSYLNLEIPARFKTTKALICTRKQDWRILVSVAKWHYRANGLLRNSPTPSLSAVCHHVIFYPQHAAKYPFAS